MHPLLAHQGHDRLGLQHESELLRRVPPRGGWSPRLRVSLQHRSRALMGAVYARNGGQPDRVGLWGADDQERPREPYYADPPPEEGFALEVSLHDRSDRGLHRATGVNGVGTHLPRPSINILLLNQLHHLRVSPTRRPILEVRKRYPLRMGPRSETQHNLQPSRLDNRGTIWLLIIY